MLKNWEGRGREEIRESRRGRKLSLYEDRPRTANTWLMLLVYVYGDLAALTHAIGMQCYSEEREKGLNGGGWTKDALQNVWD